MFIVLLKFSRRRSQAPDYMKAHGDWLARGFADGVFLLSGSLQAGQGGVIVAHNVQAAELEKRINADPFVAQDIVAPEILAVAPSQVDARLNGVLQASGD